MSTIVKIKSLYVLPEATWLQKPGISKGLAHDRQSLGIILPANEVIKIRQTNSAFTQQLTLKLLNDDNKTEKKFSIGTDWVEVTNPSISVPFIDTPHVEGKPVIQFEYSDVVKILPIYQKNSSEVYFFNLWDNQDAEFALVIGTYNDILVPKRNKNKLKNLNVMKNIDGLIAYYDRIFNFYNALAGLSFEPESATDHNIKNRYFMKADRHGVGGAYYDNAYTAVSYDSMSDFWLSASDDQWGVLHEIGHGYQGNFKSDHYFSNGEVSNNIYAACYQNIMLGDRKYTDGWLYNYGNLVSVHKKIIDNINNRVPLNKWDERSKLNIIMLMLDYVGSNSFTYFNQQYRKLMNVENSDASQPLFLDLLTESFIKSGKRINFTPFIQLLGGYISNQQSKDNLFSYAKIAYPLYLLVSPDEQETIRSHLKLDSKLCLVDIEQLEYTGIKGSISLTLNINDFMQIYGEEIIVMNGENYAYRTKILSRTIDILDLPVGVYTMYLPTGKTAKYKLSTHYLVVKQDTSRVTVDFIPKLSSALCSQKINLLGYSDITFATISFDREEGNIAVDVIHDTPHRYFPDIYVRLKFYNMNDSVIYERDFLGASTILSHENFHIDLVKKIEIYHQEPNRINMEPINLKIFDIENKTNVLKIDKFGLANEKIPAYNSKGILLKQLERAAARLRESSRSYHANSAPEKDDILMAINLFDSSEKTQLLTTYHDCIPAVTSLPGSLDGINFDITYLGYNNQQFLNVKVDIYRKKVTVYLSKIIPHWCFSTVYASFELLDANGNSIYNLDVIGAVDQKQETLVFPLSGCGGDVIRISHRESADRLKVFNVMKEENIKLSNKNNHYQYTVTPVGLEEA